MPTTPAADALIHPHGWWRDRATYEGCFDNGLARALVELCGGARVLDLGCGDGAYVRHLRAAGVAADGCDGNPHTPELSHGACGIADLARPLFLPAADWVLCVEVAEHVPREFEETLLGNIVRHARRGVVVSWAAPGQGGRGHVNEREPEWVGRRFAELGFEEDRRAGELLRSASRLWWLKRNVRVFRRTGGEMAGSRLKRGTGTLALATTRESFPALAGASPLFQQAAGRTDRSTVRAALLTPTLLMGGAERWMLSLARACDPGRVQWTGTALSAWAPACAEICAEMAAYMPVHADWRAAAQVAGGTQGGETCGRGDGRVGRPGHNAVNGEPIIRHPSARGALAAAAEGADVLITWGVPRLGELMAGLDLPVVYVSHGSGEWTLQTVRTSEERANCLVAVSEPAVSAFSEQGRRRAVIIHNGIDVPRCAPTRPRAEVRGAWGFGPQHRLIGYAGRYSFEKNPSAAAWAAQRLGGDYRAVYAGEGWKETEVRGLVGRIAGDRARFVPRDDRIGNVLSGLDVLVAAGPSEGFSLSITEAWYCGVPVVASRVGAVPELERRHGRLVSPVPADPTPDDLARAVEVALSEEFRREVVPRGRQAVCEHYTAGTMARRWEEYLCTAL